MKLYLQGISDGSYAECKMQFERAKKLLEDPMSNNDRLSQILQTFNDNPDGTNLLKAEVGREIYGHVYERLLQVSTRVPFNEMFILDALPADNGSKKTTDQWIGYWNNVTDGKDHGFDGRFIHLF